MTATEFTETRTFASTLVSLSRGLATGLVAITMLLHVWQPFDSTAAVASGETVLSIGLCLAIGFLTSISIAMDPKRVTARSRLWQSWVPWLVGFFVVWLMMATVMVSGRGNVRFAVNGFWQWTSMLVLAASIAELSRSGTVRRAILTWCLALAFGILVYGFWEYGVVQPDLRAQLQRDPEGLFRREGISLDSSAGLLLADRIRSTEMRSTFALANSLAGYLATLWIVWVGVVWYGWVAPGSKALRARGWIVAILVAVGMATALLLTKSRTAWIAVVVGTIVYLMGEGIASRRWSWRSMALMMAGGAALCCLALVGVYAVDPLILQEAGKSLSYRLDYWRGAMALILEQPVFGYGAANFQATYLRVKLPTAAESPADPHDFLLEIAHAGGVPLLIVAVLFLGLVVRMGWSRELVRTVDSPFQSSSDAETRAPRALWIGAGIGVLGAALWFAITASEWALIGESIALVATCGAAIAMSVVPSLRGLLQPCVGDRFLYVCSMFVLLLHLTASGGWMLPGVMGTGCVLFGLAWGSLVHEVVADHASKKPGIGAWVRVLLSAGLGMAWYVTMALPLERSAAAISENFGALVANPTPSQIRSMVNTDRWNPDLPRLSMDWIAGKLEQPIAGPLRAEWEAVLLEMRDGLRARDPNHALALDASGQAAARAAGTIRDDVTRRNAWLQRADEDFEQASLACEASAQGHLQAAVSAFWVGNWERMLRHCDAADAIDAATRHRDRKIQAAQVFWPTALEPQSPGVPKDSRAGIPKDFVRAEPVLRFLRSLSKP